jgi:hypothetical protein
MYAKKPENLRQFAYRTVLHWRRGDLNIIPDSTLQERVLKLEVNAAVKGVMDYIKTLVQDIYEAGLSFEQHEFYVGGVDDCYLLTNMRLFLYSEIEDCKTITDISLKKIASISVNRGKMNQLTIETKEGKTQQYDCLSSVPAETDIYALRDFNWETISYDTDSFKMVKQESEPNGSGLKEGKKKVSTELKFGVLFAGLISFGLVYFIAPLVIRNEALGIDVREAFFSFAGICGVMTLGPAILRSMGKPDWMILWVFALVYVRVLQSGRSVYLTYYGMFVFIALSFGTFLILARIVASLIPKKEEDISDASGIKAIRPASKVLSKAEQTATDSQKQSFVAGICPECGGKIDTTLTKCLACDFDFYDNGLIK